MPNRFWISKNESSVHDFLDLIATRTEPADYPLANSIASNIPVYDGDVIRVAARDPKQAKALKTEFIQSLGDGPGIVLIKNGMNDEQVIDRATDVFEGIIEDQKRSGGGMGDHFAKPNSNDRVWNAVEKHCLADPQNFASYYACDGIGLVAEAWLGLGYQITAQVNRVNPGGASQKPHRDYHLGFMSADAASQYPAHIHALSAALTLQGAVVHRDMPVESGPTMLLPYSQLFRSGYLDFEHAEFEKVFDDHYVQMPMEKGDLLFFNPAVMHGAGNNLTQDIYRFGNLLQISSGFGRAMESVNRTRMVKALYPVLRSGGLDRHEQDLVIAASAEGYPFPTNLDRDPPVNGMAPLSQAAQMRAALDAGLPADQFDAQMAAYDVNRQT